MEAFDQYEIENPEMSDDERSEYEWGDEFMYEEKESSIELVSGFKDIERTSFADECGGSPVIIPGKLSDINKEINQLTQDPVERFTTYIGAISHSITEDGLYNIGIEDRNKMCSIAKRLKNIKYLNATAYILGYLVTNGGQAINKDTVKIIFNFLPQLRDDSVKEPDVIRYARFWMKLDI
jgi:hypothetical protein